MSDDDKPVDPEQGDSIPETEPEESEEIRSSSTSLNEEEFQKYLKGDEGNQLARALGELAQGNKIAAVYIDARSGGVFFHGNAKIRGDVTGRDQSKFDKQAVGDVQAAVGQILVTDLKKINAVYVESSPYQIAQKKLNEKYLIVLYGRTHTGKWTTAIHLLNKLHPEKVIELDPAAKLDQLIDSITSDRGYVVDNMSVEEVENLSPFSLTRLSEKLREKKSHLVITVDEKAGLSNGVATSYAVVWDMTIDVDKILEKHLDWYAPDVDAEEKNQIINEEDVRLLLKVRLLPGEIDRLAELLGSVLNHQIDLVSALARYISRTSITTQGCE